MELYVVTVYIHSDNREAYSKLFSTKEKAIDYIKYMIKCDIEGGWKLDTEFNENEYEKNAGCVDLFWKYQGDWSDFIEYTWCIGRID